MLFWVGEGLWFWGKYLSFLGDCVVSWFGRSRGLVFVVVLCFLLVVIILVFSLFGDCRRFEVIENYFGWIIVIIFIWIFVDRI